MHGLQRGLKHTFLSLSYLKHFQGTSASGQDRVIEMRFTFLSETTKNLGKIYENVFQTLETRQYRRVINEREETNKAKPQLPAWRVSKLQSEEGDPRQSSLPDLRKWSTESGETQVAKVPRTLVPERRQLQREQVRPQEICRDPPQVLSWALISICSVSKAWKTTLTHSQGYARKCVTTKGSWWFIVPGLQGYQWLWCEYSYPWPISSYQGITLSAKMGRDTW